MVHSIRLKAGVNYIKDQKYVLAKAMFLASFGLGLSACVTVNTGLDKVSTTEDIVKLTTGSKLEHCLVDPELVQSVKVDTDKIAAIEIAAKAETNSFVALASGLDGLAKGNAQVSMGLNPLFNYGYAGYSAEIRGVATLLEDDYYDQAAAYYALRSAKMITGETDELETAKNVGSLGLVTRGSIYLDEGNKDCGIAFLSAAESLKNNAEEGGLFQEFVGKVNDYSLEGYERVLLLNKLALSYLLKGDPKAYPVIQRSRRYQDEQREIYQVELDRTAAEAEKKKEEVKGYQGAAGLNLDTDEIKKGEALGKRVASPYVNPLADYFSAVMAEVEATSPMPRQGVWYEAAIAWKKAVALSPNNPLLNDSLAQAGFETLKDNPGNAEIEAVGNHSSEGSAEAITSNRYAKDGTMIPITKEERIVHVIAGIGMAPERKVMMVRIPLDDNFIALKIPYISEVDTNIKTIRVTIGDQITELEMISDVEAMIGRYFSDGMPLKMAGALASGFGGYYASQAIGGGGLFSIILNEATQQVTMPSTLGWASLPKAYYAARIVAPRGIENMTLELLNKNGEVIDTRVQSIIPNSSTMVYARASSNKIWSQSQEKPFTLDGNSEATN